jgi:putative ABC transport system permease protein
VIDASAVTILPETQSNMVIGFALPDEPHGPNDPPKHAEQLDVVTPDYFRTVRIPLRSGRVFTAQDNEKSPWVMVVSEGFAKKLWPGQDPIGKRAYVGYGSGFTMDSAARTVVGVVGDVRRSSLDEAPRPQIYIPMGQAGSGTMTIAVRTRGNPESLDAAIRREVIAMDPDQAMIPVRSFEWILSQSLMKQKFSAFLLGLFACVALALSAVGIFGVMTAMVTQRTREIAVRMALGAQPRDVLGMVVAHGARLAGVGIVIGLVGALALSRVMRGLLFGVGATDPVTLGGVSLLLASVALLACYLPARRATRVDPIVTLREE